MFGGFGQKATTTATGFTFPNPSTASTAGAPSLFGGGLPSQGATTFGQTAQPSGFGQLGQTQQQQQQSTGTSFGQLGQQPSGFGQLGGQTPSLPAFGQTTAQQPAAIGFGQTAPQQPATMGFGQTAAQQPATMGFGQTAAQQPATMGFGQTAAQQPTTMGFGQTPAQQPQATGFGQLTQPSIPIFGQTQPQQQQTTTGFGQTQQATLPGFGQTAQQTGGTTGFSFPQTTMSAAATTTPQSGGGLQLMGTATTAAPNVSLFNATLGGNQNKPAASFSLSATTAAPAQQPLSTPAFSVSKTTATPTLGLSFGVPATSVAPQAAPTNFGLGIGTSTTTSLPSATVATTSSTLPSLGHSLGTIVSTAGLPSTTVPATTLSAGLSFGLGSSLTTTSAAPSFGLVATSTPATSVAAVPTLGGLGGTSTLTLGKGLVSSSSRSDQLKINPLTSIAVAPTQTQPPNYKDELIPQELMVLVESFKTFVKDQKSSSSVVNRASLKQITKVTEDAELLKRMALQLERTVAKNKALNRRLREDVARGIQDSEIVQRLSVDPQGFPTDSSLAFEYFKNIVDRFQMQAESLTVELKSMEKHMVSKFNPTPFTPEELSAIMKQLYECFVALAGRYQSIHSSITSLKLEMQRKKDPWYTLDSNPLLKM